MEFLEKNGVKKNLKSTFLKIIGKGFLFVGL